MIAFGGVLVASRMYVSTSALVSYVRNPFGCFQVTKEYLLLKKTCIFHDFGILDLRTTEPFRSDSRTIFSNLQTFGLKNLRNHERSNLRTFGLMRCKLTYRPILPNYIHFPNLYHGGMEHKKLEWAFHGFSKKIHITIFSTYNFSVSHVWLGQYSY